MSDDVKQLNERLNALEMRVIFLDDLVESLNDIVAEQSASLSVIKQQLQLVYARVDALGGGDSGVSTFNPDLDRPPHY